MTSSVIPSAKYSFSGSVQKRSTVRTRSGRACEAAVARATTSGSAARSRSALRRSACSLAWRMAPARSAARISAWAYNAECGSAATRRRHVCTWLFTAASGLRRRAARSCTRGRARGARRASGRTRPTPPDGSRRAGHRVALHDALRGIPPAIAARSSCRSQRRWDRFSRSPSAIEVITPSPSAERSTCTARLSRRRAPDRSRSGQTRHGAVAGERLGPGGDDEGQ